MRHRGPCLSGLAISVLLILASIPCAEAIVEFDPTVEVEQGHTDNISYAGMLEQSDTFSRVALRLPWENEWKTGNFSLEYSPSLLRYNDFDVFDRDEHQVRIAAESRGQRDSALAWNLYYTKTQEQGDPTSLDSGELFLTDRTDRDYGRTELSYDRGMSGRWRWGFSVDAAAYRYDAIRDFAGGLLGPEDRTETSATLRFSRRQSRDSSFGLLVRVLHFDFDASGQEDNIALAGSYRRRIARKLDLRAWLGVFQRNPDYVGVADSEVDEYGVDARLAVTRTYRTVRLSLRLRQTPSSGGSATFSTTDTVGSIVLSDTSKGRLHWSIAPRLALRQLSTGSTDSDENTAALSASLRYRLSSKFGVRLRGSYIDQSSDDPARADRSVLNTFVGLLWYPKGSGR